MYIFICNGSSVRSIKFNKYIIICLRIVHKNHYSRKYSNLKCQLLMKTKNIIRRNLKKKMPQTDVWETNYFPCPAYLLHIYYT